MSKPFSGGHKGHYFSHLLGLFCRDLTNDKVWKVAVWLGDVNVNDIYTFAMGLNIDVVHDGGANNVPIRLFASGSFKSGVSCGYVTFVTERRSNEGILVFARN